MERTSTPCGDERTQRHTRQLLRRVGDTWSLVLVSQLVGGPMRFTELLRAVDGISHRMLTQTLRSLERDGLVSRTAYPETPPRVEYALTPLGQTFLGSLTGLVVWGEDTQAEVEEHRSRFDADRH
ncbi:winged helix-turn-helix transcriptional regulator [Cryptosporangium aurantiacum]|uniref:Transcriptional regulator, HxlR family n=1 Tax=Cryptosporangium aurantiacum TaxID=134849 RepID=A0A1M7KC60_9ACTN|nr:helix-turn-helix domain-containing protein [Cryptosporangium aurantiacum]SHM62871.1 transcriptional regulator, HxlR family [Cryptosporangium aurantiacum]